MTGYTVRYLIPLIYTLLIIIAGSLISGKAQMDISIVELIAITLSYSVVYFVSAFIFFRGQTREMGRQAMHTITSVSVKFLMELFIALAWFAIAKKTSTECIILFLLLYLTFSMYFIWIVINTLKKRPL